MLCAESLRALQLAEPLASTPSFGSSTSSDDQIGVPRSAHAPGTTGAYDSVEKWVLAALRKLEKTKEDLVLLDHEPNDPLAAQVHSTIAEWQMTDTTARDAGVASDSASVLRRTPPAECLVKARGWMLRHINQHRAARGLRELPHDWGRTLANRRADAREVNAHVRDERRAKGTMYHHKHDLWVTREEITAMTYSGFTADQRVDPEILDATEAGMSIALYLSTGARGSELKKMHLQSLGHERIQDEKSGHSFDCLKLMAFDTKTRGEHLNQIVAHSDPWRCGVALFGLSVLVRVALCGPPPFTMQTDERSWKVFGSRVSTLDRRIKDVLRVAGVRRQLDDPVTYLGRHFGTRMLQHAGGSAEGGAARRGHKVGTMNYSECPLPDLLRLASIDPDQPFVPAHLNPDLEDLVDAVLARLFPALGAHAETLRTRQEDVDTMRGKADKVRTDEQLNDQWRLVRALRFACRTALCAIVARPRSWAKWRILETEATLWQKATSSRAIVLLFAQKDAAIAAMNALAVAVRRCEEAEIVARRADPSEAVSHAVTSAVQRMNEAAAEREAKMLAQQQLMFQQLMGVFRPGVPMPAPPPPVETRPSVPAPAPVVALGGTRVKHRRETQGDVAYFSSWKHVDAALEYARRELVPLEKESGYEWRIRRFSDGREDKSRDVSVYPHRTTSSFRCLLFACAEAMAAVQGPRDRSRAVRRLRDGSGQGPGAARCPEVTHGPLLCTPEGAGEGHKSGLRARGGPRLRARLAKGIIKAKEFQLLVKE
jgi:hypothetical protein